MLKLTKICKDYSAGDSLVHALKDVDISFRKSEFVSILGQSGCGKTTLLNIVGGLDKYTSGDLVINGVSTKEYNDKNWDAYRNSKIGFVFQSYNLISHMSVIANVELAMTLSGVSASERRIKAMQVLESVGLGGQFNKKPNQMSGGQMQRVAIARALVNNPDIILADEPTGALDSQTSEQIMDILKDISSDRLIIMVTHNPEIANKYSSRIIKFKDGEVVSDSNPFVETVCEEIKEVVVNDDLPKSEGVEQRLNASNVDTVSVTNNLEFNNDLENDVINEVNHAKVKKIKVKKARLTKEEKANTPKTHMSFLTALKLSFNNLKSKKVRTILTAIAGSIGIIGVALVLSISNGFSGYIKEMQTTTLGNYPIQIAETNMDINAIMNSGKNMMGKVDLDEFITDKKIIPYKPFNPMSAMTKNIITEKYVNYVSNIDKSLVNAIVKSYSVNINLLAKKDGVTFKAANSSLGLQQLVGEKEFMESQYEIVDGIYPSNANELVLVIDKYNRLSEETLKTLGFDAKENVNFSDIVKREFRIAHNNEYYFKNANGYFSVNNKLDELYDSQNSMTVKIVGIMRVKQNKNSDLISSIMSDGLAYTPNLVDELFKRADGSDVVVAQQLPANAKIDVLTGTTFKPETINGIPQMLTYPEMLKKSLQKLGGDRTPSGLNVYPVNFEAKSGITSYLNKYNEGLAEVDQIRYTDFAEMSTSMMKTLVDTITIVLVAFAAISLVVSSLMIGIITYVSVVERTKEIGILRSVGARKRDVSQVFNAETFIIGLVSGVLGILVTLLLTIPINAIIFALVGIKGIASVSFLSAIILIVVSTVIAVLAGLIPSRIAAKKDPVVALRTE